MDLSGYPIQIKYEITKVLYGTKVPTDAEWRTRPISILDVLKSLVSQVTPGQDITKLSLPSILCHPFSMLELLSHRELLLFHILFELDTLTNPLDRFMVVLKWYISLIRQETMEKKTL